MTIAVFITVLIATVILGIVAPAQARATNLELGQFAQSASQSASQSAEKSAEKTARLVGPKKDAPIPLYLRPAANQPNVGYGNNGAVVTVLEQVASFLPEADQSAAWNHIRLENAPYTEGWVQGKFLLMEDNEATIDNEA
ncbi:MAG: hypothetical protein AAF703_06920 [Cyanobacteria bacterium P01_D01_bin.105]